MKNITTKELEEVVHFILKLPDHNSSQRQVRAGIQEGMWNQELKKRQWMNLIAGSLSLFFIQPWSTCTWGVRPPVSLDPCSSIIT